MRRPLSAIPSRLESRTEHHHRHLEASRGARENGVMAALHTDYKMARLEKAEEEDEGTRVINLISPMRSSSSSLAAMSLLNDDVTEQGRLSSPSLSVHPSRQPSFTTSGHPSGDSGGVGGDLHLIDRTGNSIRL